LTHSLKLTVSDFQKMYFVQGSLEHVLLNL